MINFTEKQWLESWHKDFGDNPEMSLEDYKIECERQIAFLVPELEKFFSEK